MKKTMLLLCLLASSVIASAAVYTYRDAKGNLLYSDVPIPGKTDIRAKPAVKKTPTYMTDESSSEQKTDEPESYEEKTKRINDENRKIAEQNKKVEEQNRLINERNKKAEAEQLRNEADAKKSAQETKNQNCRIARNNLSAAQNGRVANKGSMIDTAQKDVGKYCN